MIDGVAISPKRQIHDDRGAVFHMLRSDAPYFEGFGEVYFSIVNPGVAKGWKRHHDMTLNLCVPKGRLKLVLIDQRPESPTAGEVMEIVLGENESEYRLVTVPPMIWSGAFCLSDDPAIMVNCASIPHEPEEVDHLSLDDPSIGYQW